MKISYNISLFWCTNSKGLTVIVGEFAETCPDGCNWVNIDVVNILTQCKTKNIGYLGKINYIQNLIH